MKVLYVPLDERPCNYRYPQFLSELAEGVELIAPPREYMGKMKKPSNIDEIWRWIFENIGDCSYAILSVDALIYGNIVNSRIHYKTIEECSRYLEYFRKLKQINRNAEIHAFNLVARVAAYDSDAEDPFYWKDYGYKIWRYCYLTDKIGRGEGTKEEIGELDAVKEEIPQEYLKDFLDRRKVNLFVNQKCLELVKEGLIDYLVIPKDDCAEYGFAAMDQHLISRRIKELRIMDRVMVYPGADEVGSVLFARVFNKHKGYVPRVYIRYSSTLGPTVIPKYEDRPLNESIKHQIISAGGIVAGSAEESDLLLAVHSPGIRTLEAIEQYSESFRFSSYSNYSNAEELIKYAIYYSEKYGKPFAVADVAFCNGADDHFMMMAVKNKLFDRLCAYAGWNTSQNTIGSVLAHGILCSYYKGFEDNPEKYDASMKLLLRAIITDWLMQSKGTFRLTKLKDEYPDLNPYSLGEYSALAAIKVKDLLIELIQEELGGKFNGSRIELTELSFPWDRFFEIDVELKLEKC
jgi:hypothetical protein